MLNNIFTNLKNKLFNSRYLSWKKEFLKNEVNEESVDFAWIIHEALEWRTSNKKEAYVVSSPDEKLVYFYLSRMYRNIQDAFTKQGVTISINEIRILDNYHSGQSDYLSKFAHNLQKLVK